MLYLNEDAVIAQVKTCKEQNNNYPGLFCQVCLKTKRTLCPLAKARTND